LLFFACNLAVLIAATMLLRGSFLHFIVFAMGLWILPVAWLVTGIVFGVSFLIKSPRTRELIRHSSIWLAALSCIPITIMLSYIPGLLVAAHDLEKAQAFCERLVPRIEAYYAQHGRYPDPLDELLGPVDEQPLWFAETSPWSEVMPGAPFLTFREEGADARLRIALPAHSFGPTYYVFDSLTRRWERENW
jgi:hypothetical protein